MLNPARRDRERAFAARHDAVCWERERTALAVQRAGDALDGDVPAEFFTLDCRP